MTNRIADNYRTIFVDSDCAMDVLGNYGWFVGLIRCNINWLSESTAIGELCLLSTISNMVETKKLLITTIVTVLLAFLGYMAKYVNDLSLAKRKDKLERINKQLGDFYGPLYSLLKSNQQAWISFTQKYKFSDIVFNPKNPPTEKQLIAWRHYMKYIFMPANEKIYDIIVSKSDLLIEDDMPQCLLELISHIIIYRAVIKNWDLGNIEEHTSLINFPGDTHEYVYNAFKQLKKEQFRLLHKRCWS